MYREDQWPVRCGVLRNPNPLLLLIFRLGVGLGLGGTLGRQAESIAHLLAHVRVTGSLVVGHSLDSGGAGGHLVSGRQFAVLDFEHVSGVFFSLLGPDVSVLVEKIIAEGRRSAVTSCGSTVTGYEARLRSKAVNQGCEPML